MSASRRYWLCVRGCYRPILLKKSVLPDSPQSVVGREPIQRVTDIAKCPTDFGANHTQFLRPAPDNRIGNLFTKGIAEKTREVRRNKA